MKQLGIPALGIGMELDDSAAPRPAPRPEGFARAWLEGIIVLPPLGDCSSREYFNTVRINRCRSTSGDYSNTIE